MARNSPEQQITVAQRIVDFSAQSNPKLKGKRVTKVEEINSDGVRIWLDGKPAGEMMGMFAAHILDKEPE